MLRRRRSTNICVREYTGPKKDLLAATLSFALRSQEFRVGSQLGHVVKTTRQTFEQFVMERIAGRRQAVVTPEPFLTGDN